LKLVSRCSQIWACQWAIVHLCGSIFTCNSSYCCSAS